MLQQLHDNGGHLGITKTLDKIHSCFYRPGYESDTEQWTREGVKCQQRKDLQPAYLSPLGTADADCTHFRIGLGHYEAPSSLKPIQVHLGGDCHIHQVAFPRTLATVFTNKICRNSVPSLLHSDHFTSKVVCNHDHKLASTYHLKAMDKSRYLIKHLKGWMAKSVDEHKEDWPS